MAAWGIKIIKKTGTLVISGDLNINNAIDIKARLLKSFTESKISVLDVSNIKSVDLTFLQLLLSCKKYSLDNKNDTDFKDVLTNPVIQNSLNKLGLAVSFHQLVN